MTLGILCAIPEETKAFGEALSIQSEQCHGDALFLQATLSGVPVTLVECGIGKVNAAFATSILCDHFSCKTLIFSGIAGGLDPALHVGDVVIAERLIQVDYGKFQKSEIIPYLPGIPPLAPPKGEIGYVLSAKLKKNLSPLLSMNLPLWKGRTPHIHFGTILTGDTFLNDSAQRKKLHEAHQAHAIEMEGASVAQVAQKYSAETVVIRALSDLAGDDSHLDFVSFGHYVAQAAAHLVLRAIHLIPDR